MTSVSKESDPRHPTALRRAGCPSIGFCGWAGEVLLECWAFLISNRRKEL